MAEPETMSATFDDYTPSDTPANSGVLETAPTREPEPATAKLVTPAAAETAPASAQAPKQDASATDTEAKARETGWKPLHEFGGDPRKWVEARVWVENAPLVSQIKAYKQQIRERNKALEAASTHYARVHQAAYDRALADLSEQKREAVIQQDVDKVAEIDRYIAQAQAEYAKRPEPPQTFDPAYGEWIEANPVITGDPTLRSFAISVERGLIDTAPELDVEARLERVSQAVHATYPDRFKNGRRTAPALVEGAGNGATPVNGAAKRFGVSDLNSDERTVMRRLVSSGLLTEAQYLKDIQEARQGVYTLDIP